LGATLDELAESGYGALTIEAVAARSGIARTTIYRRWANKLELVTAALGQPFPTPAPDTGDLRIDLIQVQRENLAVTDSALFWRAVPGLIADLAVYPEFANAYRAHDRRGILLKVLQRGIDRNELPLETDLNLMADLLVAPLYYRAVVRNDDLPSELADEIVDMVLAHYQARPPQPPRKSPQKGRTPTGRT
jgi:AcrR family transcriptional regulator